MILLKTYKFKRYFLLIFLLSNYFAAHAQNFDSLLIKSHKDNLHILCSEEFEGRKTAKEGQYKAASFIAEHFKQFGLQSFEQSNTAFYQDYYLYFLNFGTLDVKQIGLKTGDTTKYSLGLFPIFDTEFSDNFAFKLKLSGTFSNNNLAEFNFTENCPVLIIDKEFKPEMLAKEINKLSEKYKFKKIVISFTHKITQKYDLIGEIVRANNPVSKSRFEKDSKRYTYFQNTGKQLDKSIKVYYMPYYILSRRMGFDFKTFDQKLKKIEHFDTFDIKMKADYVNVQAFRKKDSVITQNVIGYIKGKTDKNIIITAHYDHVGRNYNGICLGADDNASGTSVIMELAKKISAKKQLNFNLIFIAFSGEEMGLLGSDFYANNPFAPLKNTYGVLNFDMVGRPDNHAKPFVHAVFAGKKERNLKKPIKRTAKNMPEFQLDLRPPFKERLIYHFASDHFSFTRKKITNVVFFTDDHSDYHTPSDTPDKINYQNMASITLFIENYLLELDKQAIK